jgi:BirA family biotin operon repressor/biotin-[acetyl-CoA-carboxylase] ligase
LATHYDIVSIESVPSTQDAASKRLDATGTTTLVVANHQTRGRGRQGRVWEEPARGLYSSLAFRSDWPAADRPMITLCTSVALAASIEDVSRARCDIKWPNDLLIDGTKVGGILVEASGDTVIVGCGVNLWWPDPPLYAGAAFDTDPGAAVALDLAKRWVGRLLDMLDAGPGVWPRTEYLRRSSTIDHNVTWEDGTGLAVGIAAGGGLVVNTGERDVILTAGEVHTREER